MGRIARIVLAAAALSSTSFAIPEDGCMLSLPRLVTLTNKVYQAVRITEKRPDGVTVMHEGGVARIPYELLPEEVAVAMGGFNHEAALAFRAEDRKAQAAWDEQTSRELQVLAEKRRIAWLEQQRTAAELAARSIVPTRPNPLDQPARPLGGGSYTEVTYGDSDTSSYEPPVVVEVPVITYTSPSTYCPPPLPRPPYNPCGTGNPPPKPPFNPCGTTGPRSSPPPAPPVAPVSMPGPSVSSGSTQGGRSNPMPSASAARR